MKYKDKVSVIIPTYNRAYCIKDSINSVLNQTYDNLEIIVVDDGSTDNTKEVIKQMDNKLIKYYAYKKNRGSSYARNYGIEKATGKYIAFQDSDDIFNPDKLEKQYANLKLNKSDLDFCKIEVILENGAKVLFPNEKQEDSIYKNGVSYELCNGNFISTQAIFIKAEIIKNNLFDEKTPPIEDYDLVLSLCTQYKISYTNEILVSLYRQKNSISNSLDKRKEAIKRMLYKKYAFNEENYLRLIKLLNEWYNEDVNNNHCEIINNLNNDVKSKEETINGLNQELKEVIEQRNEKIKKIEELETTNSKLEGQKKELEKNNVRLENELKNINEEINRMINSKSWKITKPLRSVTKKVSNLKSKKND